MKRKKFTLAGVIALLFMVFQFSVSQSFGQDVPDGAKIIFVTNLDNVSPQTSEAADQGFIDALSEKGYEVTTSYPTDEDWSVDNLNSAHLVIIGRGSSSGDFTPEDGQDSVWASVKAPVMNMSPFIARSSRLKFFNSSSQTNFDNHRGVLDAKIHVPDDDYILEGITLGSDSIIDFLTDWYTAIAVRVEDLALSNAQLVASISSDTIEANRRVLVARWDAGVETYENSGVIPAGLRSYFGIGNDHPKVDDVKQYNYFSFTENGLKLWFNEVNYLANQFAPVNPGKNDIIFVTNSNNISPQTDTVADIEFINTLKDQGYDVTISYPTDEDWSVEKLNDANLVIIGRGSSSGDFTPEDGQDSVWASVKAPVMNMSPFIARSSRLKYFNSSSQTNFDNHRGVLDAKIYVPVNDPILKGIALGSDSIIDFLTDWYTAIAVTVEDLALTNAQLVASISSDTVDANGRVLIARWEAGIETYENSGIFPAGPRSYFGLGNDHPQVDGVKQYNYYSLTENGLNLWLNEIGDLIGQYEVPKKVIFVSNIDNVSPQSDTMADIGFIDALKAEGYKVSIAYPTDEDWSVDMLNSAHLVIIGRGSSSGDFTPEDGQDSVWASVKAPVMNMSPFIARSSRLKFFNSSSQTNFDNHRGVLDAKIHVSDDDYILEGITLGSDSIIDFLTDWYTAIAVTVEDLALTNAQLVASILSDTVEANGRVLVARWDAGIETYEESGVIPAGLRSYFGIGNDHPQVDGVKQYNYFSFTENGLKLWFNEVNYLANQFTPIPVQTTTKLSDVATLSDLQVNGATVADFDGDVTNYSIELPAGSTEVPFVTANATDADATIEISTLTELPGNVLTTVVAADGTTVVYTIAFTVEPTGITSKSDPDNNFTLKSYPNPFKEVSSIAFNLPEAVFVNLDVYNNAGVKVTSLLSSMLTQGEHVLTFNAGSLAGGIYFCRLSAGNNSITQKLVLIK